MTLKSKFECDGRGCFNEHELELTESCDDEMLPGTWSIDVENGFHYCPDCKKKIIASGEIESEA